MPFCLGDTKVLTAKDKKELYAMDLEWSETVDGVQLLEIAIIPLALRMDPFFSYIRPSNASTLKPTIFKFMRVKKKTDRMHSFLTTLGPFCEFCWCCFYLQQNRNCVL